MFKKMVKDMYSFEFEKENDEAISNFITGIHNFKNIYIINMYLCEF